MVSAGPGQEWAKERLEKSPRHLEWVKVKQGPREINSFIAYPEVKEKATAVVVIHEIFGLTEWVRGVADQLAEAGYIAIAPDLLSGAGTLAERLAEALADEVVAAGQGPEAVGVAAAVAGDVALLLEALQQLLHGRVIDVGAILI